MFGTGRVGNPLYELNFKNATYWDRDWTYTARFHVSTNQIRASSNEVLLVLDGVKMGAQVVLDNVTLGTVSDQFLRYQFPVGDVLRQAQAHAEGTGLMEHVLQIQFQKSIKCGGRWMACSGGWDWAPYTTTQQEGAQTFTKGIVGSVYLAGISPGSAAVSHVVPTVSYLGPYAAAPLTDAAKGDFEVCLFCITTTLTPPDMLRQNSWRFLFMTERHSRLRSMSVYTCGLLRQHKVTSL